MSRLSCRGSKKHRKWKVSWPTAQLARAPSPMQSQGRSNSKTRSCTSALLATLSRAAMQSAIGWLKHVEMFQSPSRRKMMRQPGAKMVMALLARLQLSDHLMMARPGAIVVEEPLCSWDRLT